MIIIKGISVESGFALSLLNYDLCFYTNLYRLVIDANTLTDEIKKYPDRYVKVYIF